jgi:hypothetical protein
MRRLERGMHRRLARSDGTFGACTQTPAASVRRLAARDTFRDYERVFFGVEAEQGYGTPS